VDIPTHELVQSADAGDPTAAAALFAALYRELHALAEREMRRGGSGISMGTTTLLHETYLNLSGRDGLRFASQAHFLGYACRAMRGIMIDYARRGRALKRGGEFQVTPLPLESGAAVAGTAVADADGDSAEPEQLEALGEALALLSTVNPNLAQLVDLHFFCGIQLAEVAALRGVSERTVSRDWRKARLLLRHTLRKT
jgi:RNA polymerase sigma factor (TIGR02999 family)